MINNIEALLAAEEQEQQQQSRKELTEENNHLDSNSNSSAVSLPLERLESFPNHRFSLYEGERLDDMVESVKEYGILTPLLVWANNDKKIILSGHNRAQAAKAAGLKEVPVIIKDNINEEEARLIVAETNLRQRSFSEMRYSEQAFCLAEHYNLIKSQGKRNDILETLENLEKADNHAENSTSTKVWDKSTSERKIGQEYGLSHGKVAMYIRIAALNPALMTMLDEGQLPFVAAYNLTFLSSDSQQLVADFLKGYGIKCTIKNATQIRSRYESKKTLAEDDLKELLTNPKKSEKKKSVKIKQSVVAKYFPATVSVKDIEETIAKALEQFFATAKTEEKTEN